MQLHRYFSFLFFLPCLFLLLFLRLLRIATKLPPLLHTDPFTLFTYGNRGINLSPVTRTPIESGNANSRPSFLPLSFFFSSLFFVFFFILYVSFSRLLQRDIRNKLYLLYYFLAWEPRTLCSPYNFTKTEKTGVFIAR